MTENLHHTIMAAKLFALEHVSVAPEFTKVDAAVLAALIEYRNRITKDAWASVDTIAQVISRAARTVQLSLRRLEDAGIIRVDIGGGRGRTSRYYVRLELFECSPLSGRIKEAAAKAAVERANRISSFQHGKGEPPRTKGRRAAHERANLHALKGESPFTRTLEKNPGEEEPHRTNQPPNSAADAGLSVLEIEDEGLFGDISDLPERSCT